MIEIPKEILKTLEKYYGSQAQIRQAIGECGEFIGIAHNFDRSKRFKTRDVPLSEMLEEAVDVCRCHVAPNLQTDQVRRKDGFWALPYEERFACCGA